MKKYLKYLTLIILALTTFVSCQKDDSIYDVNWPVPTISSVSTYSDFLSSTITLTGNFTKVKNVYFGNVAGENVEVSADESTLTVGIPRTISVDGAPIKVTNEYDQSYQTTENFVPIIQETSVAEVSDIQVGLTFKVTGVNVDLLTEVTVDDVAVPVVSKTQDVLTLSVGGLGLRAGMLVDVAFKSLAKNDIPKSDKVNVVYPFISYEEVIIWDFEDGTHQYVGEGTATVQTGDVLGKQEKYFSLRAPGYKWDKATGKMTATQAPDISMIVNPHITFAIRTPVGSAGYFELDMPGSWRHFGYGYNTDGQWIIISQPLGDNWEGNGWDLASFVPTLGFKAGNADTKQDVDIAFVKITEGKYDGSQEVGDALVGSTKPAKLVVMDFEDTANWPDIMKDGQTVASLNLRKEEVHPFYGNQFFTYTDDGTLGNWEAYWGQSITTDMTSSQLSVFNDPYVSLTFNGIPGAPQYIIIRMSQNDGQHVMIQKFFPDTNGQWQIGQFSLFNSDMENWSDASTTLGAHYKTLKRFNKDVPLDKIEIIVGRKGDNTIGISIDEVVITEGPRY